MNTFCKKLLVSAVAVSMFAGSGAFAMNECYYPDNANNSQQLSYIFTQMQLTQEQQQEALAAMKTVNEQYRQQLREQLQELRNREDRLSRQERREERREIVEAHRLEHQHAITDQLNMMFGPEQAEELVRYLNFHFGPDGGMGDMLRDRLQDQDMDKDQDQDRLRIHQNDGRKSGRN